MRYRFDAWHRAGDARTRRMASPEYLRMQSCRRLGCPSAVRNCGYILEFALALTAVCSLFQSARADSRTAPPSVTQQSHSGLPRRVRFPVIDGNDIRFSRLSTAQGLSQTRVLQIVEDNQGFIWLGTQYGLDRYDGYNFRTFVNDPNEPNSLSGSVVSSLFKDRTG